MLQTKDKTKRENLELLIINGNKTFLLLLKILQGNLRLFIKSNDSRVFKINLPKLKGDITNEISNKICIVLNLCIAPFCFHQQCNFAHSLLFLKSILFFVTCFFHKVKSK